MSDYVASESDERESEQCSIARTLPPSAARHLERVKEVKTALYRELEEYEAQQTPRGLFGIAPSDLRLILMSHDGLEEAAALLALTA